MKVKRADIVFISFLILLGIGLSVGIYMPRTGSGSRVEVRIDGDTTASYLLASDHTETIFTPDGGSNTMQIRNGVAYMTAADCHDKVCVGMHGISKPGETIVCLPHKLVLAITDPDKDSEAPNEPDAVTGK